MLRIGQDNSRARAERLPAVPSHPAPTAPLSSSNVVGTYGETDDTSDAFLGGSYSKYDLLAMNDGVDETSRKANALSTASDAIGVIGGLLNNIQGSLAAAGSAQAATANVDAEQSRIDGAIVTIDAIAGSTRFGGRPLLDGSYNLSSSGTSAALPSFDSSSLGASAGNVTATQALVTLQTGGENALQTGNHAVASQIVNVALSQVSGTQAQITSLLSTIASERIAAPAAADVAISPAASPSAIDPAATSQATANSSAQRVLALLGI